MPTTSLLLLCCTATIAGWPQGSRPALDGPLKGLKFGQSPAQVAEALPPELVESLDLRLAPAKLDALLAARPQLLTNPHRRGSSANRWRQYAALIGEWPTHQGLRWLVMVDAHRGLSTIWIRFSSDEAARKALTGAWGRPEVDAKWDLWFGPGVRAAYKGCRRSGKETHCTVELTPWRPLDETLKALLRPQGGSWLGRNQSALPPGEPTGERSRVIRLPGFPTGAGYVDLELTWDELGRVVGTRSGLDLGISPGSKGLIEQGLVDLLGPATFQGGCRTWPEHRVRACEKHSLYVVEQGAPRK